MKLLICLIVLSLFVGCSDNTVYNPPADREVSPARAIVATPLERFEQITSRPLSEWITSDFSELLSMSNHDLEINLDEQVGGRNILFGIVGASVHFPDRNGYLKYPDTNYSELVHPAAVTIGYLPQGNLLGLDFNECKLRDVMEFFDKSALEYVIRVGGGVKANIYFVSCTLDGLILLFESDCTGEISRPLPTIHEILNSGIYNIHILKEDSPLLDGRTECCPLSVEEYSVDAGN